MAVGRDGQNLIRAERGRKRKDATRPATNAARMHRTLIGMTARCFEAAMRAGDPVRSWPSAVGGQRGVGWPGGLRWLVSVWSGEGICAQVPDDD